MLFSSLFTVAIIGGQSSVALTQVSVESLFVTRGPTTADTVVIFAQGGPFPDLRPNLMDNLPGISNYLRVAVHQPWTLDADLLSQPDLITPTKTAELTETAIGMLDRVVQHFVSQGSQVCVVGHSYGALLTLAWLATHDQPVSVQVLAGRLALPNVIWQNFRDGRLFWFPDGVNPAPVGGEAPAERIVAMRLQSEVGKQRYMELLRGRDLSHVTFVYGERDRLVGAMSDAEIEFLEDANANVIRIRDGRHRDMFETEHADTVAPAFTCGGR